VKIALLGIMRQKNVENGPKEKSTKLAYHVYINIALSNFTSAGGSKYWFLVFLKQKSDIKEKFICF